MKKIKVERCFALVFILISWVLITGCERDDGNINKNSHARNELYDLMNEWYYWYDVMPQVDKNLYTDPYELLEAMRYLPDDHYSFVLPREVYENLIVGGKYIGYGFAHRTDDQGNHRILFVYKDSPLYSQGIRRGFIITKINSVTLTENSILSDLLGPNEIGVTNTFDFKSPSDSVIQITADKKEIQKNSVIHYDTLDVKGTIVGHMVYTEFIQPSFGEFEETFAFFNTAGVEEMIVDLRYNGGGLTDAANYLANLITGPSTDGKLSMSFQHNNKKTEYDVDYLFQQQTNSLDVSSVVFITSKQTASASEAIINALEPYLDVTVVGDSTYGKPVGMYGFTYGDWAFLPIVFKIVNANGFGDYFMGIPPDYDCHDDITRAFGDREEACLKEVIYFIENGSFSGTKHARTSAPVKKAEYKDLLKKKYLQ